MTQRPETNVGARQIKFGSTVSETFSLDARLSSGLLQAALDFWSKKGLIMKEVTKPDAFSVSEDPLDVGFVCEGGTIWTTEFENYKKAVTVSMTGGLERTQVFVNMVLPGGLMSAQDRKRAAQMLWEFNENLRSVS